MQRDRLAISLCECLRQRRFRSESGHLRSCKCRLERQREQEKVNLGEKVLQLLLGYEAAMRQVQLVESQIKTFEVSRQVFRIRYQFGEGTTEQWLSFEEKENKLTVHLTLSRTKQEETVRELRQLVGVN